MAKTAGGVEMWTMVSESRYNRSCLHIATSTFITFCGRDSMLSRDYVEFQDGKINKIGEARQVLETIPEWQICKKCLRTIKNNQS